MRCPPWLRLNFVAQNNLIYFVLSGIKVFNTGKKGSIPILLDRTFLHSHNPFSVVRFARSCISEKRFYLVFELKLEPSTFYSTKTKIKNFHETVSNNLMTNYLSKWVADHNDFQQKKLLEKFYLRCLHQKKNWNCKFQS